MQARFFSIASFESIIAGRVGHRERADTVPTVIGGGERYVNMQEVRYPGITVVKRSGILYL